MYTDNTSIKPDGFRFLKWQIYDDAQNLYLEINTITKDLPKAMRFEATSQLLRSSHSVVLNIAEGAGKESDKELRTFLSISMGSLYETVACLDSLVKLNLIKESEFQNLKARYNKLASQIGGFRKSLKQ
jgi:four helix bundle protein